jgi:transposase-like protein
MTTKINASSATTTAQPSATAQPSGRQELTTEQLRRRLKEDSGSVRQIARRYGVNPKTVVRWRNRPDTGLAAPKSRRRALTPAEEGQVIAARKFMLLPLDDCLYMLRKTIPHLSRATLHRCLQRYGVSRLSESRRRVNWAAGSKAGMVGTFVIDANQIPCSDGDCLIVTAADIHSKLLYSEIHEGPPPGGARGFLARMQVNLPYRIAGVLIGDSARACEMFNPGEDTGEGAIPVAHWSDGKDPADRSHSLSLDKMFKDGNSPLPVRTIEEFRRYIGLSEHSFYTEARLKSLGGLTPCEYVRNAREQHPELFLA